MRSVSRLTDTSINTVSKLLVEVGKNWSRWWTRTSRRKKRGPY